MSKEDGKYILDACCGSRMFWFDKNNPDVLFADIRSESHVLCDGRTLNISPDVVMDFTNMNFKDETFRLVVFDPPHIDNLGVNSWMAKKYGRLTGDWRQMIKEGFNECMRVLQPYGVLIFKWNESTVKTSEVIKIIEREPLFGHTSGRQSKTIWMCFMKQSNTLTHE